MRRLIRRFLHDQRGNIAMMGVASMLVVCGFTAFGVDIGLIFLDQRRTQSTADLAAIVAASTTMVEPPRLNAEAPPMRAKPAIIMPRE